jgi:excisionase family DNA binding protein
MAEPPVLLTVAEVRDRLRVSKGTLYALLASGEIESLTIRRSRRIPAEAVDRFIQKRLADAV